MVHVEQEITGDERSALATIVEADEERHRTKIALDEAARKTEEAAQQGRSEIARLTIDVQKAKHAITKKEDDIIRLSSDLGWANERIKKLEMALQESASGLMRQTEVAEKWEFRSGEARPGEEALLVGGGPRDPPRASAAKGELAAA